MLTRSASFVLLLSLSGCAMPLEEGSHAEALTFGSGGPFTPAPTGCAMAHCDGQMTDLVGVSAPLTSATRVFSQGSSSGAMIGLGCSSNGTRAVCTNRNAGGDNVEVYDANGARVWGSGSLLHWSAAGSAAMIDSAGGVIAVDRTRSVRFRPDGTVVWNRHHVWGMPISPVQVANGIIVLAKSDGPISTIDPNTGAERSVLSGYSAWTTINTPGVNGNRVYVSMQNDDDDAILLALDVSASGALTPAWEYAFRAPSGASPLVIGSRVYFDGIGCVARRWGSCTRWRPAAFGVEDGGSAPSELFAPVQLASRATASFARDPRGGFWLYEYGSTRVRRLHEWSGAQMQSIDVNALIGDSSFTHYPASAMSIATSPSGPVLIVDAAPSLIPGAVEPSRTTAIALQSETLLWSVRLPARPGSTSGDTTAAQYPIVRDAQGRPVVVVQGWWGGPYFLGER